MNPRRWTDGALLPGARRLRRHLLEWRNAVHAAGRQVSWWRMLRALASGSVPRPVWRRRMRTCLQCPLYHRPMRTCGDPAGHGPWDDTFFTQGSEPPMAVLGCHCYVVFKAAAAAPYPQGCYARAIGLESEGWGPWPDSGPWPEQDVGSKQGDSTPEAQ